MSQPTGFWDGTVHLVETADLHGDEPWAREAHTMFAVWLRLTTSSHMFEADVVSMTVAEQRKRVSGLTYGDLVEFLENIVKSHKSLLIVAPNLGCNWDRVEIESSFLLIDLIQRVQKAFPEANIKILLGLETIRFHPLAIAESNHAPG